jgi:peptidoglycan/LPS O-acetylase OafA/YrhL
MSGQINLIQALRGIAVGLVVFYHSSIVFHGGFIGVDVFFVISGVLITKSVLRSLEDGKSGFGLVIDFYSRRVIRLFPALSVTTLTVALLSTLVFSPFGETSQILKSAIAGAFFFANVRFFLLNDYTSLTGDPFRHLWSLGVEEQFYLAFPIVIVMAAGIVSRAKLRKTLFNAGLLIVLGSFIFSLLLSYGIRVLPLPERFAFYSPVTRAWQIGIGVLIGLSYEKIVMYRVRTRTLALGVLSGTVLIVMSGIYLDQYNNYPGLFGTLPVVGAALVIVGALKSEQIGSIKLGVLSHLGDLSYSLYLIHWPLLVLLQRAFADSALISLISIPMSYVLARLQYSLVEKPMIASYSRSGI